MFLLWYKGCVPLCDIGSMFEKEILSQLKSEHGGLQTVLRNCADVFCGKFSTKCKCCKFRVSGVYTGMVY